MWASDQNLKLVYFPFPGPHPSCPALFPLHSLELTSGARQSQKLPPVASSVPTPALAGLIALVPASLSPEWPG